MLRNMDLNHTHMMLTGTLQKAEALNGKYTLILNVLKSRFPHAWEIAINEVFPEKAVQVSGCASESGAGESGAGEGLDSRLRGNDEMPVEVSGFARESGAGESADALVRAEPGEMVDGDGLDSRLRGNDGRPAEAVDGEKVTVRLTRWMGYLPPGAIIKMDKEKADAAVKSGKGVIV